MSLLIGPLIAALVLPCAAQTYRVAGTVVDSESRKPLNRTRVTLTDGPIAELSAITVADGKFSFDVPQGKYTLLAAHRDWGDTYGKILPSSDSGAAIITGPERDTGHLEFRFRAPVAIHGKVVDQDGEPIPSATLELFLQSVVAGRKRLRSLGKAESDDFGEYYWSSLNAGTYYLAAVGEPWYYATPFADEAVTTASGTPPTPYGLSYFPGATDASAAFPLVLRPGADAQADFTLRPALGATLRFVCPDGWCGGSLNLYAMGPGNMQALIRAERTLGTEIQSVPPGRYTIQYSSEEKTTRRVIDVSNGEVTIDLEPKPAPTLSGKVSFQNPEDRPHHPVYVNLLDDDTGESHAVVLGPDGSFSWPEIAASRGRLFLSGDDGFFITQMSVDGAIAKDGVIEFLDGAVVRVGIAASTQPELSKGS